MRNRQIGSFTLPPLTPWARGLIIALVAIFAVQVLVRMLLGFDSGRYANYVESTLALSGTGVLAEGKIWQPLTFFWISPLASIIHIIVSAISVYFFGSAIETRVGGKRMLLSFISAGIAGGLLTVLIAAMLGAQSDLFPVRLVGAQAATSGLIAILCWWWKDRPMNLVIIQPKGSHLLIGYAALTIVQGLLYHPYYIVPDLGGILMGILIGSGRGPYRWVQELRLWRLRRKIRTIRGGKDDRDWVN